MTEEVSITIPVIIIISLARNVEIASLCLALDSASDPPSCRMSSPHSKAWPGFADAAGVVGGRAYEPSMNTTDLAPGRSGGLYGGLHTRDVET